MSDEPVEQMGEPGTLVVEGELRSGFTQFPNAVLLDPSLDAPMRLLYGVLLSFAWAHNSCYPGQERLSQIMGLTERQTRTHLKKLEAAGLVHIRRRGSKSSVYTLSLWKRSDWKNTSDYDRKNTSGYNRKLTSEEEYEGKKTKENIPPPSPSAEQKAEEKRRFDAVWSVFLRRLYHDEPPADPAPLASSAWKIVKQFKAGGEEVERNIDNMLAAGWSLGYISHRSVVSQWDKFKKEVPRGSRSSGRVGTADDLAGWEE